MAGTRVQNAYTAVQVTVTNSRQNLSALIKAIDANAPDAAREVTIQCDPGSTDVVYIGDANLTSSRMGYVLNPGGSRTYRAEAQNVYIGLIHVMGATTGQKLNIEIQR